MKNLFLTVSLLLNLLFAVTSLADEVAMKHHICIACHTHNEPSIFPGPQLGGLSAEYIYQQLDNFKHDRRGQDAETDMMKNVVLGLTEKQARGLSEWASDLDVVPLFDSSKAVESAGHQVYEAKCQGCHSSFMGRLMTGSPRLDGLDSSYMMKQLALFKSGIRTLAEPTKHQTKMLNVVKSLTDEEFLSLTEFIEQAAQ